MQTDERSPFGFLERISREGGPIPFVEPHDLKKMWPSMRDCPANTATGFSAVAGLGLSDPTLDGVSVLGLRLMLLRDLFERGVLRDHLVDGEITDQTFQAAATLPCDWEDCCEAMMQLNLRNSSEEIVSKAKEMFLANGYDPGKPKIDSKFLAWMLECR